MKKLKLINYKRPYAFTFFLHTRLELFVDDFRTVQLTLSQLINMLTGGYYTTIYPPEYTYSKKCLITEFLKTNINRGLKQNVKIKTDEF